MNFLDNITLRRHRTKSESIVTETSIEEVDDSISSMPDISEDGDTEQLGILREQIEKLTTDLNSAHREIELLSLENNKLKKSNEDLLKRNNLYKKVTQSPTPRKTTPRLKKQVKANKMSNQDSQEEINNINENKNENMHKNLTNTLNNTPEKQILRENSVSKSLGNYSDKSNQTCTKSIELTDHSSQTIYTKNKYCNNGGSKKKIIILADQQGRGIRQLLQKLAGESFGVFCFMKPGATLTEVLNSVKPQSLNLSENDVLIILGGTNDKNPELLQTNELTNVLSCYNLTLEFREQTRAASGTCIDNMAHNFKGCSGKIIELGISDHSAQLLRCPVKKTTSLRYWQISWQSLAAAAARGPRDRNCRRGDSALTAVTRGDIMRSYLSTRGLICIVLTDSDGPKQFAVVTARVYCCRL
ncbi:hypothetical protein ACJJTC_004945 [Scirpophaga incertulas]